MKKTIFIDRDGTLIEEPPITKQVNSLEEMVFLPGVITSLVSLCKAKYKLIMVTNQDGLGLECNPSEIYEKINNKVLQILEGEGVFFDEIFVCPHFEEDNCKCRKPLLGILGSFLEKNDIDYNNSYMIGDRDSDIEFAKNMGITGYKVGSGQLTWKEISKKIIADKINSFDKT